MQNKQLIKGRIEKKIRMAFIVWRNLTSSGKFQQRLPPEESCNAALPTEDKTLFKKLQFEGLEGVFENEQKKILEALPGPR